MKETRYFCDRCKKEMRKDNYRWFLHKPKFRMTYLIAGWNEHKIELCERCFDEARDFFLGWGHKTPKPQ